MVPNPSNKQEGLSGIEAVRSGDCMGRQASYILDSVDVQMELRHEELFGNPAKNGSFRSSHALAPMEATRGRLNSLKLVGGC